MQPGAEHGNMPTAGTLRSSRTKKTVQSAGAVEASARGCGDPPCADPRAKKARSSRTASELKLQRGHTSVPRGPVERGEQGSLRSSGCGGETAAERGGERHCTGASNLFAQTTALRRASRASSSRFCRFFLPTTCAAKNTRTAALATATLSRSDSSIAMPACAAASASPPLASLGAEKPREAPCGSPALWPERRTGCQHSRGLNLMQRRGTGTR